MLPDKLVLGGNCVLNGSRGELLPEFFVGIDFAEAGDEGLQLGLLEVEALDDVGFLLAALESLRLDLSHVQVRQVLVLAEDLCFGHGLAADPQHDPEEKDEE